MVAPIFGWRIKDGSTRTDKWRIRGSKMGDGYSTKAPDGLNARETSHNIETLALLSKYDERYTPYEYKCFEDVVAFLEERQGYLPFFVTLENSERIDLVTCDEWQVTQEKGGLWSVSMKTKPDYSEVNFYQQIYDMYGSIQLAAESFDAFEKAINGYYDVNP